MMSQLLKTLQKQKEKTSQAPSLGGFEYRLALVRKQALGQDIKEGKPLHRKLKRKKVRMSQDTLQHD